MYFQTLLRGALAVIVFLNLIACKGGNSQNADSEASKLVSLPNGKWQALETDDQLWVMYLLRKPNGELAGTLYDLLSGWPLTLSGYPDDQTPDSLRMKAWHWSASYDEYLGHREDLAVVMIPGVDTWQVKLWYKDSETPLELEVRPLQLPYQVTYHSDSASKSKGLFSAHGFAHWPEIKQNGKSVPDLFANDRLKVLGDGLVDMLRDYADFAPEPGEEIPEHMRNYHYSFDIEPLLLSEHGVGWYRNYYTFTGGAHGMHWQAATLQSLPDGKASELRDWVTDTTAFLRMIRRWTEQDFIRRYGADMKMFGDWPSTYADYAESTAITPLGLLISFAPYTVGPYALGSVQFLFPWEKAMEHLRAGSLAYKVADKYIQAYERHLNSIEDHQYREENSY
jgi:hypothetical protein